MASPEDTLPEALPTDLEAHWAGTEAAIDAAIQEMRAAQEQEEEEKEPAPRESASEPVLSPEKKADMREIERSVRKRNNQIYDPEDALRRTEELVEALQWVDPEDRASDIQMLAEKADDQTWDAYTSAVIRSFGRGVHLLSDPEKERDEQHVYGEKSKKIYEEKGVSGLVVDPILRGEIEEEVSKSIAVEEARKIVKGGGLQILKDFVGHTAGYNMDFLEGMLLPSDVSFLNGGNFGLEPGTEVVGDHASIPWRHFIEPMDLPHKQEKVEKARNGDIHPVQAAREYEEWRKEHTRVVDENGVLAPRVTDLQRQYDAFTTLLESDMSDDELVVAMENIPLDVIPDPVTRAALQAFDPDRSPRLWQATDSEPLQQLYFEPVQAIVDLGSPLNAPSNMVSAAKAAGRAIRETSVGGKSPGEALLSNVPETFVEDLQAAFRPAVAVGSELIKLAELVVPGVDVGVLKDLEQTPMDMTWRAVVSEATAPLESFRSSAINSKAMKEANRLGRDLSKEELDGISVTNDELEEERRLTVSEAVMRMGRKSFPEKYMEAPRFTLQEMLDVAHEVPSSQWSNRFDSTYKKIYRDLVVLAGAEDVSPMDRTDAIREWLHVYGWNTELYPRVAELEDVFNKLELKELPTPLFTEKYGDTTESIAQRAIAGAERYSSVYKRVFGTVPQAIEAGVVEAFSPPTVRGDKLYMRESVPAHLLRVVPGVAGEFAMEAALSGIEAIAYAGDYLGAWDFEGKRYERPGAPNYLFRSLDNIHMEGRPGTMLKFQDIATGYGLVPGDYGYGLATALGAFAEFLPWEAVQFGAMLAPFTVTSRYRKVRKLVPYTTSGESFKITLAPERAWKALGVMDEDGAPVPYPGVHEMVAEYGVKAFDDNLAIGADLDDVIGPSMMSDLRDAIRIGGYDPVEVAKAVRDRGAAAAQDYLRETAWILENKDEFTAGLRNTESYKSLREAVVREYAAGTLGNIGNARRGNAVSVAMAWIESHAVFAARTRGYEGAIAVLDKFLAEMSAPTLESFAAADPRAAFVRPPDSVPFSEIDSPEMVEQWSGLSLRLLDDWLVSADIDSVRATIDKSGPSISGGTEIPETPELAGRLPTWRDVDLSEQSVDDLIRASAMGRTDGIREAATMELGYRAGLESFDQSTDTISRVRELLSEAPEIVGEYNKLFDRWVEEAAGVRKAVEQGPRDAKPTGPQYGKQQILLSVDRLLEAGALDEEAHSIVASIVSAVPENVLKDIRLSDELLEPDRLTPEALGRSDRETILGNELADTSDRIGAAIKLFRMDGEEASFRTLEPESFRGLRLQEVLVHSEFERMLVEDPEAAHGAAMRSAVLRVARNEIAPDEAAALLYDGVHRKTGVLSGEDLEGDVVGSMADRISGQAEIARKVGVRTYVFVHELGHAIMDTFLSDAEQGVLLDAMHEELGRGFRRDTPYVRSIWASKMAGELPTQQLLHEFFAENFAEYVLFHKMRNSVDSGSLGQQVKAIFDALIERISDWAHSWFGRSPRIKSEYHPLLIDLIDRIFEGRAQEITAARDIYNRRYVGSQPLYIRGVSEMQVDEPIPYTPDELFRVGITGSTEKVAELRSLVRLWQETKETVLTARDVEARVERQAALDDLERRLLDAYAPIIKRSLSENLPEGTIRIRNADESGRFESSEGQFGAEPIEPGVYLEIEGPRDVVLGRLAAASKEMLQDGLVVREVVEDINDLADVAPENISSRLIRLDEDGVERAATFTMDLPDGAGTKAIRVIREQLESLGLGATLRGTKVEIPHLRESTGQSAIDFLHAVRNLTDAVDNHLKRRKIGSSTNKWAHESVLVAETSARDIIDDNGVLNGRVRSYDDLIRGGEDAERALGGPGPRDIGGPERGVSGLQGEAGAGSPVEEGRPGGLPEARPGEPRPVVEEGDPLAERAAQRPRSHENAPSSIVSRQLSGEFPAQSDVLGGKPHEIIDRDIEIGLNGRVERGEISERQRDFLLERLGKASPLEDVGVPLTLKLRLRGGEAKAKGVEGGGEVEVRTRHGSTRLVPLEGGRVVRPLQFGIPLASEKQRTGVGTKLFQDVLAETQKNFPDAEMFRVYAPSEGVVRFWEKQGFKVTDPNGPLDSWVMERPITTASTKAKAIPGKGRVVEHKVIVRPVTKDGFATHLPGGFDGTWSFADVNYVTRRSLEMVHEDIPPIKFPDEVQSLVDDAMNAKEAELGRPLYPEEEVEVKRSIIENYDEVRDQYLETYDSILLNVYGKLGESYGTQPTRPNPADYFDADGTLIPSKAGEWRELMTIHLLDVLSHYAFAITSRQTNLMDNQIYAAIARPRSMEELRELVNRFTKWERRKGSKLSRQEASYLLGFAPSVPGTVLASRFEGAGLIDLNKDVLPLVGDTVSLRNYDHPEAPIVEVIPSEVLEFNANKIGPRVRMATTDLRKSIEKLNDRKAMHRKNQAAVEKFEDQLKSAKTDKQKESISQKLENARKRLEKADSTIKELKLAVRRNRSSLKRSRTGVAKKESIALTEDPVFTSTAETRDILDLYRLALADFEEVLSGRQQWSWMEKHPNEGWPDTVKRLSGSVGGLATKITTFGLVWQNPRLSTVGAIDIHMVAKYAPRILKGKFKSVATAWMDEWKQADNADDNKRFKSIARSEIIRKKAIDKSRELGRSLSKNELSNISASKGELDVVIARLRQEAISNRADYDLDRFLDNSYENPALVFWRDRAQSMLLEPEKISLMPVAGLKTQEIFSDSAGNYAPRVDSKLMQKVLDEAKKSASPDTIRRAERALEGHKIVEEWRDIYGDDAFFMRRIGELLEQDKNFTIDMMSEHYEALLNMIRSEAEDAGMSAFKRQWFVWDQWRGYLDAHVIAYPGTAMLPGIKAAGWKALWGSFKEAGFSGSPTFRGRPLPSSVQEAPPGRVSGALYMAGPRKPSEGLGNVGELHHTVRQTENFFTTGNMAYLFDRGEDILRSLLMEDYPDAMDVLTKHFDSEAASHGDGRVLTDKGRRQAAVAYKDYWDRKVAPSRGVLFWFEYIHNELGGLWRRMRGRPDLLPNEVIKLYDEAFRVWDEVDDRARGAAIKSDRNLRADFVTIRPEIEEGAPRGEAYREGIRASKIKESKRINLEEARVKKGLGLVEGQTEADPVVLMRNAIRYVTAERTRNVIGDQAVRITSRSIVPRSQLARINERVSRKFEVAFGPAKDLAKQIERTKQIDPETGEQLYDRITGRALVSEELVLTDIQSNSLSILIDSLSFDPVARGSIPKTLMDPSNPLKRIDIDDYQALRDAARDAESGIAAGRSRYAERVPKSLGYAAVRALVSGMEKYDTHGIIANLREKFVVAQPLGRKLNKKGQLVAAPEKMPAAGGHVVDTMDLTERKVGATGTWALRIINAVKRGNPAAGLAEMIDGLHRTLSPVIEPSMYEVAQDLHKIFEVGPTRADGTIDPPSISDIGENLDRIMAVFMQSKWTVSDLEYSSITNIRGILQDWDGVRDLSKAEIRILKSSARHLDVGLKTRIQCADQQLNGVVLGLGGSKDDSILSALEARGRGDRVFLYRAFYEGRWDDLFNWAESQGRAVTGEGYNQAYAKLEMILRLHALDVWGDLVDDMAMSGVGIRIEDLTKGLDADVDHALYSQRVIHYLNTIVNYGGMRVKADPTAPLANRFGLFSEGNVPPGFTPEIVEAGRIEVHGEGAAPLYPKSEWRKGGFSQEFDTTGRMVIHDKKAYTAALKILEDWGFRVGLGKWVEYTLPVNKALGPSSGQKIIIPEMMVKEIEASISRVSGEGEAYGVKGVARGTNTYGPPRTRMEALETGAGNLLGTILSAARYDKVYGHIKMGVTGGIIMPNPGYYTGVGIGSIFQVFQHTGLRGVFTQLRHPKLATELVTKFYGEEGFTIIGSVEPLVTKNGDIYTVDSLERMSTVYGLQSSFVKTELARTLAEDIHRKEPGTWNTFMKAPRAWQKNLIEVSAAIDNWYRVNIFMMKLEDGLSPSAAAQAARAALFDYADLTPFEKSVMRRTVIFYSYMRKNLDLFYDTMLTNPQRVLGVARLMKGINENYIEDSDLVIPEYDVGRFPLLFRDAVVNDRITQKEAVWLPLLPITDAVHFHSDVIELLQWALSPLSEGLYDLSGGKVGSPNRYERDDVFGALSRLSPLISMWIATGTETDLLRGRPLKAEVIPSWYIELDAYTTGGMMETFLGAREATKEEMDKIKLDYPDQTVAYVAENKKAYWMWRNIFHVGPIGGRGHSIMESFDRGDTDVVKTQVMLAKKYHDFMVRHGLKEDVSFEPWHVEYKGGAPRPGYSAFGELMSALGFRARAIPTTEELQQRAIREHGWMVKELLKEVDDR